MRVCLIGSGSEANTCRPNSSVFIWLKTNNMLYPEKHVFHVSHFLCRKNTNHRSFNSYAMYINKNLLLSLSPFFHLYNVYMDMLDIAYISTL